MTKEAFDTERGLWLATDQNELYPNPHSYAKEREYCLLGKNRYNAKVQPIN